VRIADFHVLLRHPSCVRLGRTRNVTPALSYGCSNDRKQDSRALGAPPTGNTSTAEARGALEWPARVTQAPRRQLVNGCQRPLARRGRHDLKAPRQ
jgi:hypothetical protein